MEASKAITRQGWTAFALAAAVIVFDQLTKLWVVHGLGMTRPGNKIELSPIFDLTMVWNRGVSFGFAGDHGALSRWGFTIFALIVAAVVGDWARRNTKPSLAICFGLLMGGAIGNAIDRFRLGYVVDFLDFSGAYFPWVFNIADAAITVGAVFILYEAFWPLVRERLESARVRGN